MEEVFRIFFDLRNIKLHYDDDSSDRMSRLFSAALIIILATIVSARQCLGEAIHCWCPEVCAPNHEKYANLMCWVDDTYFVPFPERMPHPDEARLRKVTYYQWVPIILMLQAMLFLAPWVVWRVLTSRCGVHLGSIVEAASKAHLSLKEEEREMALHFAVYLFESFLKRKDIRMRPCFATKCLPSPCSPLKWSCSSLYISYIVVKILYLSNAVGQLFLLDQFLGGEFYTFGYHVISYLLSNRKWIPTDRFPHVTLCDFRIRQSTNVNQYTVQCVLPINIFNEKVFAIIWFWLVTVAAITFASLVKWLWSISVSQTPFKFVRNYLEAFGCLCIEDKVEYQSLKIFSNSYLGRDGLFVLKLVAANSGEMVAADILCVLWMKYGRCCHTRPMERNCFDVFKVRKLKRARMGVPDVNNHFPVEEV